MVHFTYVVAYGSRIKTIWKIVIRRLKWYLPFVERVAGRLVSLFSGRLDMNMHLYNLNKVLRIVQNVGIDQFHAAYTNHGGELGR